MKFIFRFIVFIVLPMRVLRRRSKNLLQHFCEMSMCKMPRVMSQRARFVSRWLTLASHVTKSTTYLSYETLCSGFTSFNKWIDLISSTIYGLYKTIIEKCNVLQNFILTMKRCDVSKNILHNQIYSLMYY